MYQALTFLVYPYFLYYPSETPKLELKLLFLLWPQVNFSPKHMHQVTFVYTSGHRGLHRLFHIAYTQGYPRSLPVYASGLRDCTVSPHYISTRLPQVTSCLCFGAEGSPRFSTLHKHKVTSGYFLFMFRGNSKNYIKGHDTSIFWPLLENLRSRLHSVCAKGAFAGL